MVASDDFPRIVALALTYLPEDKLTELLIKLDEEIGKKSNNEITKSFLASLRKIVDKPTPPAPMWLWFIFYILVTLHILVILGVLGSFFILPIYAPWYIAVPSMTFIWFFSTTRVECQSTNLENAIRKKLGMKQIGGFVGHYFKKPVKILWNKVNSKRP